MKLLIVSNITGSIDKIVEMVQHNHNVVAKETNVTTNTLAQNVGDQLRGGTYDQAIVIARDPIAAGMHLNKQEGVDAAVCSTVEDAQLAKKNGANVIVIRNLESEELMGIVSESLSGGALRGLKLDIKMPKIALKPAAEEAAPQIQAGPMPKEKQHARASKKAEQPEEQEVEPATPARSGIVGKIKDFLGIM